MQQNNDFILRFANSETDLSAINDLLKDNYQLVKQESSCLSKARESFFDALSLNMNSGNMLNIMAFSKDEKNLIGTMTIYLDKENLPLEREQPIILNPFREKKIKLCEAGRYALAKDFRFHPLLNLAIFMKLFDYCLLEKIDVVVTQASRHTLTMLKKFGLKSFYNDTQGFIDREFGIICYPLYLDVREKLEYLSDKYGRVDSFSSYINERILLDYLEKKPHLYHKIDELASFCLTSPKIA